MKISKNHKTPWRKIYEVLQQELFEETENLPENFLNQCNNNLNKPHNIPTVVKNNPKLTTTEQGLYAQVVMLHQKDLNITEEKKMKM